MGNVYNRVKVNIATTGTGLVTLGSAITGAQTFVSAGVIDGDLISYVIEDSGNSWEIGTGIYNLSAGTLTRNFIQSNTGSLLNLSGTSILYISPNASDLGSTQRAIFSIVGRGQFLM